MDKENLKILSYDNGMSKLPIYPSDEEVGSFSQVIESDEKGYESGGVYYSPRSVATGKAAIALGRYNKALLKHVEHAGESV